MSDVVIDLGTDVSSVPMAIAVYTLTMADFMITGGKLGDILRPRVELSREPVRNRVRRISWLIGSSDAVRFQITLRSAVLAFGGSELLTMVQWV